MTKVAVVYSGGRHWGGIETYLANLFRLYDRDQLDLLLVSLGEWDLTRHLTETGLGGQIRILSGARLRLRTVRDLARVIKNEHVRLIVSQGTVSNAYSRLAALLTGVPELTVVHSNIALDYPRAPVRWAYALSDRALRGATQKYITVSAHLKELLVGSGVGPDKITVVYNGVDVGGRNGVPASSPRQTVNAEEGDQVETHTAPDTQEAEFLLVSAGRLHPVKNYDALIRAVGALPDNVRLTIWGEGGERAALQDLVQRLGLDSRVSLPGESADMQQALEGAYAYLQPSKSEGCSFAVAEAMLSGKPVVVTPCGGLPEQVQDGFTGLVTRDCSSVAIAEAIGLLVSDRKSAARMGRAGQATAEEMYDMGKWLSQTTKAFQEAAGEDPQR